MESFLTNRKMEVTHVKPAGVFGSICVLCLRTKTCATVKSDPGHHYQSRMACVKYISLISRYLRLESELTKISTREVVRNLREELSSNNNEIELDLKEEVGRFVLCDSCSPLAEAFSKTFLEYELNRLQLEEKLLESVKIIERSTAGVKGGKTTAGLQNGLRGGGGGPGADRKSSGYVQSPETDILSSFRTKLQAAGAEFRKTRFPQVRLKRSAQAENSWKSSKHFKMSTDGSKARKRTSLVFTQGIHPSDQRTNPSDNKCRPNEDIQSVLPRGGEDVEVISVFPHKGQGLPATSAIQTSTVTYLHGQLTRLPTTSCNSGVVNIREIISEDPERQTCCINGCREWFPKSEVGSFRMLTHLATHNSMQCSVCNLTVGTPLDLAAHELMHSTCDQPYGFKCSRCSCFFSNRAEYQEHFLKHERISMNVVKCFQCKRGFSQVQKKQFDSHIARAHPRTNEDLSQYHECEICHAYFRKREALWKHLKNGHKINCKDGQFRCSFCAEAYFMSSFVDLHQEFACIRPEGLICPDDNCRMSFNSKKGFRKHVRSHGSELKLPECPICKLKLYDRYSMRYHIMTHNGEQVKLVFPAGSGGFGPVIIPVENQQATPTPAGASSHVQLTTVHQEMPSTSMSPSPQIVSVSGASTSSSSDPPSKTETECTILEPDSEPSLIDLLDPLKYFKNDNEEESNDASEPFMYLEQDIPQNDNDDIPTEDPFAWILPDDYLL